MENIFSHQPIEKRCKGCNSIFKTVKHLYVCSRHINPEFQWFCGDCEDYIEQTLNSSTPDGTSSSRPMDS
jgi:hypothetical protein